MFPIVLLEILTHGKWLMSPSQRSDGYLLEKMNMWPGQTACTRLSNCSATGAHLFPSGYSPPLSHFLAIIKEFLCVDIGLFHCVYRNLETLKNRVSLVIISYSTVLLMRNPKTDSVQVGKFWYVIRYVCHMHVTCYVINRVIRVREGVKEVASTCSSGCPQSNDFAYSWPVWQQGYHVLFFSAQWTFTYHPALSFTRGKEVFVYPLVESLSIVSFLLLVFLFTRKSDMVISYHITR